MKAFAPSWWPTESWMINSSRPGARSTMRHVCLRKIGKRNYQLFMQRSRKTWWWVWGGWGQAGNKDGGGGRCKLSKGSESGIQRIYKYELSLRGKTGRLNRKAHSFVSRRLGIRIQADLVCPGVLNHSEKCTGCNFFLTFLAVFLIPKLLTKTK